MALLIIASELCGSRAVTVRSSTLCRHRVPLHCKGCPGHVFQSFCRVLVIQRPSAGEHLSAAAERKQDKRQSSKRNNATYCSPCGVASVIACSHLNVVTLSG